MVLVGIMSARFRVFNSGRLTFSTPWPGRLPSTQILMDIANRDNSIVVGTGDLSELVLGWATYNGDHMSMYDVNASVPKTLIRHIIRYYSEHEADESIKAVLNDILDTPISPELLPAKDGAISQKTEDLVGPYELHDFFIYHVLRLY